MLNFINTFLPGQPLNATIFQNMILGNSLLHWLESILRIFLMTGLLIIFKKTLILIESRKHILQSTNIVAILIKKIKIPFLVLLSIFVSMQNLTLPAQVSNAAYQIMMIACTWQTILILHEGIFFFLAKIMHTGEEKDEPKLIGGMIRSLIGAALWLLGLLFILSNLGINIITLIAGLGVGGAAIAIGMQNILQDIFSSLAIMLDKPFAVGDFIIVGDNVGTVQKIGIKTTRIKSLQGEEIIITNRELTNARIQNFRSMKERRVLFTFGVAVDTDKKIIASIPGLLRDIIDNTTHTRFERTHLIRLETNAITFECVYFVQSADYTKYMDINETIHLAIIELFAKKGIALAGSTQSSPHIKK